MRKSTAGGNNFEDEREQGGPETVIGDADNVQKTSYVVGHGTDPSAQDPAGYNAGVKAGGGVNVGLWIVAAIAIVIALIYGFGILA